MNLGLLYFISAKGRILKRPLPMTKLCKSYAIFWPVVIFIWMQTTSTDQLYLLTNQTNCNSAGTFPLVQPHFMACCMTTVDHPQHNSIAKSALHHKQVRKHCIWVNFTLKSIWKDQDSDLRFFGWNILMLEIKRSS